MDNRKIKANKKLNEKKQDVQENTIITNENTVINDTDNDMIELLSYQVLYDSYFMKCQFEHTKSNKIFPKLHKTKNYSYFRCRCQHNIKKGNNERQCNKYMICSNKLYYKKNNSITPKYYRKYL